jgi:uncharacterized beta-barrel protein YwiB (DUF1934 family)
MDKTEKRRVRIRIESTQDGQQTLQTADGDLYPKGDHVYIRYEEAQSELGRTTTLLKLEPGQIRIIRQGDVASEQTFVPGERRIGFYQTVQGRLELEMQTHGLESEVSQGLGWVTWSYELFVQGEPAGLYEIKLVIQEELSNGCAQSS